MCRRKCFSFLIPLSLLFFADHLNAQSSSPNLSNAYYLAKALVNMDKASNGIKRGNNTSRKEKENTRISDSMKSNLTLLLGGAFWYAKNDYQNIDSITQLLKYAEVYPVLGKHLKRITSIIYDASQVSLLTFELKELEISLAYDPILQDIRQARVSLGDESKKLMTLNKDLDSIIDALSEKNTLLTQMQARLLAPLDSNIQKRNADSLAVDSIKLEIAEATKKIEEQRLAARKTEDRIAELKGTLLNIQSNLTPEQVGKILKLDVNALKESQAALNAETEKAITNYNLSIADNRIQSLSELSPPSIQLPNQSQLIDAMAIYLVNRVKQESIIWFFQMLQNNIELHDLVKVCFRNCYELLQNNESYNVPKFGSLWRYAISKDFAMMPSNILQTQLLQNRFRGKENEWFVQGMKMSWQVASLVNQKYSYRDIVAALYSQLQIDRDSYTPENINTLITLLYSINEELLVVKDRRQAFLQLTDLMHMSDDEFETMLDLIDMKYNNVIRKTLLKDQSRISIMNTRRLNIIRRWMGNVLLRINQMEKDKDEFRSFLELQKENKDLKFQYNSSNTWASLKELMLSLDYQQVLENDTTFFKPMNPTVRKMTRLIGDVQEIYSLLAQKNFAASVGMLFGLVKNNMKYSEAIEIPKEELESLLRRKGLKAYLNAVNQPVDSTIQDRLGFSYAAESNILTLYPGKQLAYIYHSSDLQAIAVVQKMAAFLNDIAYAQGSKELANVIEAYALPPGSYKKKRASWFSFDINAYVGGYVGVEFINKRNTQGKYELSRGSVYGLTAPIGFALSKTLGRKLAMKDIPKGDEFYQGRYKIGKNNLWQQSNQTFTLFVSLIDIGSVVSYRFGSSAESLPQQVKWSQVISPGLHLNWGIKGTPLVWSLGYQYTPELRRLKGTADDIQHNAHRIYTGLKFDIPLFNLYAKTHSSF